VPHLKQIGHAALSSFETLRTSYELASMAIRHHIPGDFVECGVFGGAQCAAMAMPIMEYEWREGTRRVHLFDTFAGLPAPSQHDFEFVANAQMEGKALCSLAGVKVHMANWGIDEKLLVYHEGLFADTIPVALGSHYDNSASLRQIAVLRIDADLYESTEVAIRYLYPLVSPGGWIIIDDYGLSGCRLAVDEYMIGEGRPNYPPVYWQKANK